MCNLRLTLNIGKKDPKEGCGFCRFIDVGEDGVKNICLVFLEDLVYDNRIRSLRRLQKCLDAEASTTQ